MKNSVNVLIILCVALLNASCASKPELPHIVTSARTIHGDAYAPTTQPVVPPRSPVAPTVAVPLKPEGNRIVENNFEKQESDAEVAERVLSFMRAAYASFQYDDVLARFEDVEAHYPHMEALLGEAHLLAGAASYLSGYETKVQYHFSEAAKYAPDLQPNPRTFPQKLIDMYARVARWTMDAKGHGDGRSLMISGAPGSYTGPRLLTGTTHLKFGEEFSFALQQTVRTAGDIYFAIGPRRDDIALRSPGGTQNMGSGSLSALDALPVYRARTWSEWWEGTEVAITSYNSYQNLVLGQRYSVRCADLTSYAAIRIEDLSFDGNGSCTMVRFAWVYRTDGSPELGALR